MERQTPVPDVGTGRPVSAADGRIDVEGSLRGLMEKIAEPLGLGTMHERHFVFKPDWPNLLRTNLAKMGQGNTSLSVAQLRTAIDYPDPRGLTSEVQNLLLLVFMEHGHYACQLHGQEYDPGLKDLPDSLVLSKQELAEPSVWKGALDKTGAILGVTLRSQLRTANHQNELVKQVSEEAEAYLHSAETLVEVVRHRLAQLGVSDQGQRLATAEYALSLISLWRSGFVEPVEPRALPLHIYTQQIMALCLQERGIIETDIERWIGKMPGFQRIAPAQPQRRAPLHVGYRHSA